jgi:hypothetical protein
MMAESGAKSLWLLSPTNHTDAVCDVNHPPELPRHREIQWSSIRTVSLRTDFVTNASRLIRERPFRIHIVCNESEVESNSLAHAVRGLERGVSDVQPEV